mmetsp:Transcript_18204/g.36953  ORF Transcript_18204/g.36953 Transcript_18204/m.36953 type:complete len:98 (+) Transcript_18204:329-622(+)
MHDENSPPRREARSLRDGAGGVRRREEDRIFRESLWQALCQVNDQKGGYFGGRGEMIGLDGLPFYFAGLLFTTSVPSIYELKQLVSSNRAHLKDMQT